MKDYAVRKVKDYNPYDDLIVCRDVESGAILSTVDGEEKLCLPTAAQEKWFWLFCQENGIDGNIISTPLRSDSVYEFETKVFMGDAEHPVSCGHALRLPLGDVTEKFPPYETAETMSRSRALSAAGFGPEIAMHLKKRDEELRKEKADKEKEKAGAEMDKAKKDAEKTLEVLSAEKKPVKKKPAKKKEEKEGKEEEKDPFAEAGVEAPEWPEPTETPVEEKPVEKPAEEMPAEKPAAKPKKTADKKAETKTEPEKKPEKAKLERFVIEKDDTGLVPSIRAYAGKDIDTLPKNLLKQILDRFEDKISPAFAEAIRARI